MKKLILQTSWKRNYFGISENNICVDFLNDNEIKQLFY